MDLTFPILLDFSKETTKSYKVFSIPTTFLISPEGKIIAKAIGYRDWNSKESKDMFNLIISKYLKGTVE